MSDYQPKRESAAKRKEVYDLLESFGCQLDTKQREGLSKLLMAMQSVELKEEVVVTQQAPVEHKIICLKYAGVKMVGGKRKFGNYKKTYNRSMKAADRPDRLKGNYHEQAQQKEGREA